jgi:hypothetical protein
MLKRLMIVTALVLLALCGAAFAQHPVINEVLYDTPSNDDPNAMFTEIWGLPNTSIAGWKIVGTNGNAAGAPYDSVVFAAGTTIPIDGYFVLGANASVPNVDYIRASLDWQNAGSTVGGEDCDGLWLYDNTNALIDHVCYGTCIAGNICTGEGGANAPD